MSFELAREESLAENAVRLARTRLDRVLGALAVLDRAPPSPEAVHESRRDLKKLRALLRLARHTLGRDVYRQENAAYRDAGRVLSVARDAQVLRHTFDKLRSELVGLVPADTLNSLHRELADAVHVSEATLGPDGRLPAAISILTAARERVEHWPQPDKTTENWRKPGRGLAAVYRRGRDAMRRADVAQPEETDFHEWRKQVKHLAYHFRLLHPLWDEPFKGAKKLHTLSDLLGNEHDLAVLADALVKTHPELGQTVATINRHIDLQRGELQQASLKLGRRLYKEKPGHFKRRLKSHWQDWRATDPAEG